MGAELALLMQLKYQIGDIKESGRNDDTLTDSSGTWLKSNVVAYDSEGFDSRLPKIANGAVLGLSKYNTGVKIGTNTLIWTLDYRLYGYSGDVSNGNTYTITFPSTTTFTSVRSMCGTTSRVVISDNDTTSEVKLSYSNNGVTFTSCAMPANTNDNYRLACKPDGSLWVACHSSTATAGFIFTSTDGITWTSRTPSGGTSAIVTGTTIWFSAAGVFVYFNSASSTTLGNYSANGYTLTSLPTMGVSDIAYSVIEVDGNLYFVFANKTYKLDSSLAVTLVSEKYKIAGHDGTHYYWVSSRRLYYGVTLGNADGVIDSMIHGINYTQADTTEDLSLCTSAVVSSTIAVITSTIDPSTSAAVSQGVLMSPERLSDVKNGKYTGFNHLATKSNKFMRVK